MSSVSLAFFLCIVMPFTTHKQKSAQNAKKKPPPRPPPPNFSKYESKSTYNLNQPPQSANLIEWSPPNSPKVDRNHHFGGSVSSSFSSSTSSLASSKKSLELELSVAKHLWPLQSQIAPVPQLNGGATFHSYLPTTSSNISSTKPSNISNLNIPSCFGPTIIRPQLGSSRKSPKSGELSPSSGSPPMPNIPPPSPPNEIADIDTAYGIALYDYPAYHPSDLAFQAGDVIILLRRINDDWLYGKVLDKEGIFPETFVDIEMPLKEEENIVTALYDFKPQMPGDLPLKTGQKIKVTRKISHDWLFGETDGKTGQFPSNFVNRIPKNL